MRRIAAASLTLCAALACACGPGKPAEKPPTKVVIPQFVFDLVMLEAKRGMGRVEVTALTRDSDVAVRVRAIRALGRLRDPAANDRLVELLEDTDAEVANAAAWALGVSGDTERSASLVSRYELAVGAEARAEIARAIGRIGKADAQTVLISGLQDESPRVRAAAAIGAGMYGRRGMALSAGLRRAVYGTVGHVSRDVRYAAAFALAREHEPPKDIEATRILTELSGDVDAEVRAVALFGLGQRKAGSQVMISDHLKDGDWRVRVSAMNALLARDDLDAGAVAAMLAREWAILVRHGLNGPEIHVLSEGLSGLAKHARKTIVVKAVRGLNDSAARRLVDDKPNSRGAVINAGLVHCKTSALLLRAGAGTLDSLRSCGGVRNRGWPRHERLRLVAQVAGDGLGGDKTERALGLARLREDLDPRVRAAAITATVAHRKYDDNNDDVVDAIVSGLQDKSVEVAGTAADALGAETLRNQLGAEIEPLLLILVQQARARVDTDMELRLTFLSAIKDARAKAGTDLCQAALTDANLTVRGIARECVEKLTGEDPGPARGRSAPALPSVDATALLGKRVMWKLETTRGTVEIELDSLRAPWHVAVLVKLTRERYYDGRLWHRVVPNFVVQGGSPLDSAWGGPAFVVPGEPSAGRYESGTVGIADAGMDTGGSQFFIMHSRAPHLDGRYTIVGRVVRGTRVVDQFVVGDKILSANVEVD